MSTTSAKKGSYRSTGGPGSFPGGYARVCTSLTAEITSELKLELAHFPLKSSPISRDLGHHGGSRHSIRRGATNESQDSRDRIDPARGKNYLKKDCSSFNLLHDSSSDRCKSD